jgi:hypothetical protein
MPRSALTCRDPRAVVPMSGRPVRQDDAGMVERD